MNQKLRTGNEYNPHKVNQRHALADVFLLIIQREYDTFVDLWNPYKITK